MERVHVFKDGRHIGSTDTKEEAIEMIRLRQSRETHPILRAEFSIIKGEEEVIPYASRQKQPTRKRDMER